MSVPVQHHYVPQFYLRSFADTAGLIWVFDKITQRTFHTSTRNVAAQQQFHTMSPLTDESKQSLAATAASSGMDVETLADPLLVERKLAEFEAIYSGIYHAMLEEIEQTGQLTQNHRAETAEYLAMQILRTAETRQLVKEIGESVYDAVLGLKAANLRVRFNEERAAMEHMGLMFSPLRTQLADLLLAHIWIIGRNTTATPLYTSDNPIVKQGHVSDTLGVLQGWNSPGIEIAFPLNPTFVLRLYAHQKFGDLEPFDGRQQDLTPQEVEALNTLQVVQCWRQIYCRDASFQLAERLCQQHPELTDPNRPRIQVL